MLVIHPNTRLGGGTNAREAADSYWSSILSHERQKELERQAVHSTLYALGSAHKKVQGTNTASDHASGRGCMERMCNPIVNTIGTTTQRRILFYYESVARRDPLT